MHSKGEKRRARTAEKKAEEARKAEEAMNTCTVPFCEGAPYSQALPCGHAMCSRCQLKTLTFKEGPDNLSFESKCHICRQEATMGMMKVTELLLLLENRATAMGRTPKHGEGEVVVYIAPCRDEHCPCKGRSGEMTVYDPTEELSHRFAYGLGPV